MSPEARLTPGRFSLLLLCCGILLALAGEAEFLEEGFRSQEELPPCSIEGGPFENLPFEAWSETYHGRVAAVVEEYFRQLGLPDGGETLSTESCSAAAAPPAGDALDSLAGDLSDEEEDEGVTQNEIGAVLLAYLDSYECAMIDYSTALLSNVLDDSDADSEEEIGDGEEEEETFDDDFGEFFEDDPEVEDDRTGVDLEELLLERGERAEEIEEELLVSRLAMERVLVLISGFGRMQSAVSEIACLAGASLDLRNALGLLAEANACMPKAWDVRGPLRDFPPDESQLIGLPGVDDLYQGGASYESDRIDIFEEYDFEPYGPAAVPPLGRGLYDERFDVLLEIIEAILDMIGIEWGPPEEFSLLPPWTAEVAHAQDSDAEEDEEGIPGAEGLYMRVLEQVRLDQHVDTVEPEVEEFVLTILQEDGYEVFEGDVLGVLMNDRPGVCSDETGGERLDAAECDELFSLIRELVDDEAGIRALGRDLQAITSSFEVPIGSYPGRPRMPVRYASITSLWKTENSPREDEESVGEELGDGEEEEDEDEEEDVDNGGGEGDGEEAEDDPIIEPWPDDGGLDAAVSEVAGLLAAAGRDTRLAAVWGELHGYRLPRDEREGRLAVRQPESDIREDVEAQLAVAWDILQGYAQEANLGGNDLVVFEPEDVDDEVRMWGRSDDVGLEFPIPLEPVYPVLLADDDTRGGLYPEVYVDEDENGDEDEDDVAGICTHPFLDDGYLCRPIEDEDACEDVESEDEDGEEDEEEFEEPTEPGVFLTECDEPLIVETAHGPDVCEEVLWKVGDEAGRFRCTAKLECQDVCNDVSGFPNADVTMQVYKKKDDEDGDGAPDVQGCVARGGGAAPDAYELIRAAALEYYVCENDIGENLLEGEEEEVISEGCCHVATEASAAMCRAMLDDGVFTSGDGTPLLSAEGIPFDVVSCSEIYGSQFCGVQCGKSYPEEFVAELQVLAFENPAGLPESCDDALAEEPRVDILRKAAEGRDDVCGLGREVQYRNTIGNNACYVGKCIENTLEVHRLIPGRSPFMVGDPAFPDDARLKPDPLTGTVAEIPPTPFVSLPVYRPGQLMKDMDIALCQLNGLPPMTPPVLCAFDPLDRFLLPATNPLVLAQDVEDQQTEYASPATSLQRISLALGARKGRQLFENLKDQTSKPLAAMIELATQFLRDMNATTFPDEMCSLGMPPIDEPFSGVGSSSADPDDSDGTPVEDLPDDTL